MLHTYKTFTCADLKSRDAVPECIGFNAATAWHGIDQGCQMVFQTKNPNLGKFWSVLDWKMLRYSMTIWYILCLFGTFFSGFGIMYQEKSGNPGIDKACDLSECSMTHT
jgi:hypothetical protein